MAALSVDVLFDAAVRIQLLERSITITFADNTIRMKFPTTRRLAEFLDVPHYYVLPYFAMMEQEELVTRAERVGILTTAKGSRKMIELMRESIWWFEVLSDELPFKVRPNRGTPRSTHRSSVMNCLSSGRWSLLCPWVTTGPGGGRSDAQAR